MTPAQFQAWFEAKLVTALDTYTGEVRDDVQASISSPCPQYNTGHGGHSHAGNPPFSETGNLYRGITTTPAAAVGGGAVSSAVNSTVSYAAAVEARRPYLAPAARRAENTIAPRLSALISASLP